MKRLLFYMLIPLLLTACDSVLDVEPEIKTTYTNFFKNEKDAAALLYSLNANLRSALLEDIPHETVGTIVDKIGGGYPQSYEDVRNLVPASYSKGKSWAIYYQTIYSANVILDNAYRFEDISEERLEYYKRQACFVKGLCYFLIARQWGDAPIVPNSTIVAAFPRESVDKVLAEAIRNAEIALDLPEFEDLVDETGAKIISKQYGCKGAVSALLANIYAWRAGLFGEKADWEKAEQYCSSIINGETGFYELAEDPEEVCEKVMKRNSDEGIFEGEYYFSDNPDFPNTPYVATSCYIGYPFYLDQLPTDEDTFEIYKSTVKKMYGTGDRRLDAYFIHDDIINEETGDVIPVDKAFLIKWNHPIYEERWDEHDYLWQDVNRVVWRLADIMLLRAECRARLGAANAADDLNEIRRRAYGNRDHDYKASEGDLRYIIFKEREKELLFEGHRYYDVMRNGYWKTELTEVFVEMSQSEFDRGAQYYPVGRAAFTNNDLMRQNEYWLFKGVNK